MEGSDQAKAIRTRPVAKKSVLAVNHALETHPTTTSPLSLYFWYTSSRPLYWGVNPQADAVFTMMATCSTRWLACSLCTGLAFHDRQIDYHVRECRTHFLRPAAMEIAMHLALQQLPQALILALNVLHGEVVEL